jgi:hypothetical protein
LTEISKYTSRNKCCIKYQNLPSGLRLEAHSEGLSQLEGQESWNFKYVAEMDIGNGEVYVDNMDRDRRYVLPNSEKPHSLNHAEQANLFGS